MKLIADREPLLEALTRAARVAPRRNTIPILSHVHLEATPKHQLVMTATDMDREVEVTIEANVREAGAITASAEHLRNFVQQSRDGEQIELDATAKPDHLVARAGRARVTLPTLPPADFPTFQILDDPATVTLDGKPLADALAAVAHCQSNEETRYYLNGVYFHRIDARTLALVTTDGHRLAKALIVPDTDLPDFPSVIVPRETVGELLALGEAGGPLEIEIAATAIAVNRERVTIASKLIDGVFPDYNRVIPAADQPKGFDVDRDALARAAKRAAGLADNDKKSGRCIAITPAPRMVRISSKGSAGDIVDEIDADTAAMGNETPIGVNARYLADALDAMAGATARFRITDASSPMRITDPADDQVLHVLMPMRIPG